MLLHKHVHDPEACALYWLLLVECFPLPALHAVTCHA